MWHTAPPHQASWVDPALAAQALAGTTDCRIASRARPTITRAFAGVAWAGDSVDEDTTPKTEELARGQAMTAPSLRAKSSSRSRPPLPRAQSLRACPPNHIRWCEDARRPCPIAPVRPGSPYGFGCPAAPHAQRDKMVVE